MPHVVSLGDEPARPWTASLVAESKWRKETADTFAETAAPGISRQASLPPISYRDEGFRAPWYHPDSAIAFPRPRNAMALHLIRHVDQTGLITTTQLHEPGSEASSAGNRLACTFRQLSQTVQTAYYSSSPPLFLHVQYRRLRFRRLFPRRFDECGHGAGHGAGQGIAGEDDKYHNLGPGYNQHQRQDRPD